MTFRATLTYVMVAAFVGIATVDLTRHSWRTGVASALLAAVNFLLLTS